MAAENQDLGSAPPVSVTGTVGSLLRESRERRGEDIGFVANALRIRQPYLQAIEDGHFQELPGSTYAVGFVRGYAEYLGLDSKEIVRRFRQENGELTSRAELVFPSAVSEGSIPTGALLVFAVAAAAAAYGAWYWYQTRDTSIAEAVPALPERLAALIHRPMGNGSDVVAVDNGKPADGSSATASSASPQAGQGPEDVIPPSDEDSTAPAAGASSPSAASPAALPAQPAPVTPPAPPPSTQTAAPSVAAPAAPPVAPAAPVAKTPSAPAADAMAAGKAARSPAKDVPADAAQLAGSLAPAATEGDVKPKDQAPAETPSSSRVVLQAKDDCWIEIRDGRGQIVLSRLLHRGDAYPVPRRPGLVLTAGNAGALNLVVDGNSTGLLGRTGMVRRDIPLDAERLKAGLDPVPAPSDTPAPPAEGAVSDGVSGGTAPANGDGGGSGE